jgi:hypothetical protein
MLDIEDREEETAAEAVDSIQADQGILKQTVNQVTKRVPQLMVLATAVIAIVDPGTISLPPHTR